VLSFDLSGKGGPTSSYTTTGIPLRIIPPRKPYPAKDAFVKVEIYQGGSDNVEKLFETDIRTYIHTTNVTIF
jgi:hypothetical protein